MQRKRTLNVHISNGAVARHIALWLNPNVTAAMKREGGYVQWMIEGKRGCELLPIIAS